MIIVPGGSRAFASARHGPRLRSVFNLSGSELVFLVLIALVVLGPDKLPEAMRKAGKAYADFKKMTSGFQSEMRSVLDEPMRELRETAELAKKAASWDTDLLGTKAPDSRPAETKPVSASMADQTPPIAPPSGTSDTSDTNDVAVTAAAAASDGAVTQNGALDATTRRLHAQAAADLAASSQPSAASATAVAASGQMSGFTPAPVAAESDGEPEVEAVPKPFSPNFTSAAPQAPEKPHTVADPTAKTGAEPNTDQVVVE